MKEESFLVRSLFLFGQVVLAVIQPGKCFTEKFIQGLGVPPTCLQSLGKQTGVVVEIMGICVVEFVSSEMAVH